MTASIVCRACGHTTMMRGSCVNPLCDSHYPGGKGDRYELDYDRWMLLVDEYVKRMIGLPADSLPDYAFRDAYESDQSALDVALELRDRFESGDV